MQIPTEPYLRSLEYRPSNGQHIIAHHTDHDIVVYQAYNDEIAGFAIKHQHLGGDHFSYNRMSWIKPNFLWMMFRCGWAQKANQERVLAIRISKQHFDDILSKAVFSSFNDGYKSHKAWRADLETKDVRLQWDPDHDPYGNKLTRRAIQLGLKGKALEEFGKERLLSIEDITEFVLAQVEHVNAKDLNQLLVPVERIYIPSDASVINSIGLDQ